MTKKIISFMVALIIISVSVLSFATTANELNDKKNELQNSIDEAEEKINDIEDEKETVKSELEKLNEEIAQKQDEIDTITSELATLNSEITTIEGQLKVAEEKYDSQYEALKSRMVAQYKMGNVSYLDVLLNSNSLSDFVSRYYIIGKVAEYDTELLDQLEEQKTAIEKAKKELETKKEAVSEKQAKLKVEEITLSNKKTNKNKYVSQLDSEQQEQEKLLEELQEEFRKTESALQEIARQAAANSNSGGGYVYTGGKLTWPCPGYSRISSTFGYRGSAATGGVGSANHKGIDLAASQGTPILAAESGVVIKVSNTCTHNYAKTYSTRCSCGGGYGNYLMISHGGGLVTLYGHCTTISVSTGDTVSAGQQIATVGCTGYSTGNHLHFGVLLNGTYVNPAPYLGM